MTSTPPEASVPHLSRPASDEGDGDHRGDDAYEQRVEGLEARQLDDEDDRDELRRRYGMLLQELRVLLPGVQILVAFLLTAPFASGFHEVDDTGRVLFGAALTSGLLSILAFTTPIALHRFGERSARSDRLVTSVRALRVGVAFLGVSLLSSFAVVVRVIYSPGLAAVLIAVIGVAMASSWLALPQLMRRHDRDGAQSGTTGPQADGHSS